MYQPIRDSEGNVIRNEGFIQVVVWPGTVLNEDTELESFNKFFMDEFKVRVQYLETIATKPDLGDTRPDAGDRKDVFFAIHEGDVSKFTFPKIQIGARWIEDVLSKGNYRDPIYPERVFKYMSWKSDSTPDIDLEVNEDEDEDVDSWNKGN